MSAAGHSSPPPTSAAVLEFICLFTHDLRRKQKRWQDGRLKYHTFNSRVMVYDDRGNFVGDMHWRHDWDLVEGEEVELERGGIIVQVQELSSRCEQDLSQLLDKRAKEKEQRQMQAVARSPAPGTLPRSAVRPVVTRPVPRDHAQPRHLPLHQVIGTPSGHHGKASVPKESPFEQRQQAAESTDERAAKRRKYDNPPPSKSGYASALFGQALTLSATPMSSVPVSRRQTTREPDPSPDDKDMTTRTLREEPKPPLREQPKASRHFNRPSEHPRPVDAARNTRPSHRDVDDDDDPPLKSKQDRSLLRRQEIDWRREPTSVDNEVIEIDDPAEIPTKAPAHPVRAGKEQAKQPKARKKPNHGATVSLPKQSVDQPRKRLDRVDDLSSGERGECGTVTKAQEKLENTNEGKLKKLKPAAKRTGAKSSPTESIAEPEAASFSTRKPSIPVTELRIKSRKKRGLMMMSDLPKKPYDKPCGSSTVITPAAQSTRTREFGGIDYPFRSPSPLTCEEPSRGAPNQNATSAFQRTTSADLGAVNRNPQSLSPETYADSGGEETGRDIGCPSEDRVSIQPEDDGDLFESSKPPLRADEAVIQRRISNELGEDEIFLAPSPVPAVLAKAIASEPYEASVENANVMASNQDNFGAASQMNIDDVTTKPIDDLVDVMTTSPLQEKTHDPYRIPSSSPEERFELPSRLASSPKARSSPNISQAKAPTWNDFTDEQESASNGNRRSDVKNTRRSRAFLRNVVIDEDDELDVPSEAPEQARVDVVEAPDSCSDTNLAASEEQKNLKKATKPKSKAKVQMTSDEEETGFDAGDVASKKQAKPKQATKRKSKAQYQEPAPESEDEQPLKRRRQTRKTRAQAKNSEATPLLSEQDGSEGESSPPRAHKNSSSKPSEIRPRLEKIKRSVKSRELVGFNLSALNAPLGHRGIGAFTILSSPANESIQRKIDNHGVMEPSSASLLDAVDEQFPIATSGVLQVIAEADKMGIDAPSPGFGHRNGYPEPATPHGELPPVMGGGDNTVQPRNSKKASSHYLPALTSLTEDTTAMETGMDMSVQRKQNNTQAQQNKPQAQQTSTPSTSQPKERPAALVPHKYAPANEARITDETAKAESSELMQHTEVNVPAKESPPTLQRHTATVPSFVDLARAQMNDVRGAAAGEEPSVTSLVAVADPFVQLLKKHTPAMQFQSLNNVSATNEQIPQQDEVEETSGARSVAVPTLPAFKASEQNPKPALQLQPARTANTKMKSETPKEVEGNSELNFVSALPAATRSGQNAIPSLRQQSCRTSDLNTEAGRKPDSFADVARQTVAEEASEVVKESTQPHPAIRRQPPTFKPPAKAEVTVSRTDIGPSLQSDDSTANVAGTKPDNVQPSKSSRLLSRYNSAVIQAAGANGTMEGSGVTEEPRADSGLLVPLQRSESLSIQQSIPTTKRINNLTAKPPQLAVVDSPASAEGSTKPASNARIVNPASRGRKAALKSDAKGPIPQRMLPPTQPFVMVPISTADFASTPIEEPSKEPERPKKKMTFPGFQSARGEGPWSREAFDLLESGRPG